MRFATTRVISAAVSPVSAAVTHVSSAADHAFDSGAILWSLFWIRNIAILWKLNVINQTTFTLLLAGRHQRTGMRCRTAPMFTLTSLRISDSCLAVGFGV